MSVFGRVEVIVGFGAFVAALVVSGGGEEGVAGVGVILAMIRVRLRGVGGEGRLFSSG